MNAAELALNTALADARLSPAPSAQQHTQLIISALKDPHQFAQSRRLTVLLGEASAIVANEKPGTSIGVIALCAVKYAEAVLIGVGGLSPEFARKILVEMVKQ